MNPVIKVGVTQDALNMMNQLHHGDLIFDTATGFYYCKSNMDKYSIVVDEKLAPCLGTKCDKAQYCLKYKWFWNFSPDNFIMRDLSVETEIAYDEYDNNLGTCTCCSKENRHKYFVWDE
jgi:hypothetical protein